jgi:short chain dehydrogenase
MNLLNRTCDRAQIPKPRLRVSRDPYSTRDSCRLHERRHRGPAYRKSLPVSTYTNGTKGTIDAMPQVSRAISPRSLRKMRLIQISTTAIGCRMHSRSSKTFFMPGRLPSSFSLLGYPHSACGTPGAPREHGDHILAIPLDVTDHDASFAAVRPAHDHFGGLDAVVNNAGYGVSGAIEELTEEQARRQIDVNLFGALWVTKAAPPILREQGSGWIVQVSSIGRAPPWTAAEPIAAYDGIETIAQRRSSQQEENNGSQPGNPDLAAQALLHTLERDDAPFRLLLGNVAHDVAINRYESRLEEFRAGEPVARGADDR